MVEAASGLDLRRAMPCPCYAFVWMAPGTIRVTCDLGFFPPLFKRKEKEGGKKLDKCRRKGKGEGMSRWGRERKIKCATE